jgi:hypothetical protein
VGFHAERRGADCGARAAFCGRGGSMEKKRGGGSGRGSQSTHGAMKEGGPMAGKAHGRWRWAVSGGRR